VNVGVLSQTLSMCLEYIVMSSGVLLNKEVSIRRFHLWPMLSRYDVGQTAATNSFIVIKFVVHQRHPNRLIVTTKHRLLTSNLVFF
jgi:hypothetical protein